MANGSDFVTWSVYNEHTEKTDNAFVKLATVETRMTQVEQAIIDERADRKETDKKLDSVSGLVKIGIGIAIAVNAIGLILVKLL